MAIFIGVQRHSNIYVFCNKTRAKYASTCKTTGHPDVWSVVMAQLLGKPLYVFDVDREDWLWWNPAQGHYQPCEGMTEDSIALPTLQDKTAIVGTREEDQAIYPTLERLFKHQ